MKNNKESTIDDELRSSSKQSIVREVIDKKRKKKNKKKLDGKVSHLGKKRGSPDKSKKKSKLPHLDEEEENSSSKKKRKMNDDTGSVKSSSPREKKRKIGDGSEGESSNKMKGNKEDNDMAEIDELKAKNKKPDNESPHPEPRRVRFSSNVQVFPMNEDDSTEKIYYYEKNGNDSCNTIYNEKNNFAGKRFSPYEDQLIRDAVQKYIAINQLGEDAIERIVYSGKSGLKGCWKEISKDLPWRHFSQVYNRGRLLLQMSELAENRGFTEEEIKKIKDFHAQNGPKWSELAKDLKKNRMHIKDAYRRTRLRQTLNKGKWTQDEYQKLYDLVHRNICAKIHEKKKSKNPMTRDDISWEAISENLKTRVMASCCHKWYDSLASPLVREAKWSDSDDYRLLDALYYQEACCEEDVDWDNLVDKRAGEYCQKRWKEMVRHIGDYKERSFRDQINLLKGRYNFNMLKYVEALKNKNREGDDEEEDGGEQDADKDKEEENEEHDAYKHKEKE